MNTNLFAILHSPNFPRLFDGVAIPVTPEPLPTTWELGTPDPLAQLSEDAE